VFFQYVPDALAWAPSCHWGHATSPDLLHWTESPVALRPGEGDDGCWSGSVVRLAAGSACIFYTSVRNPDYAVGKVRRAWALDGEWDTWRKEGVVVEAPPDVAPTVFRDPYVFQDRDCWRMVVGAGLTDGRGAALVYASRDLSDWEYEGLLASRPGSETEPLLTGTVWECPQLVQIGDRHVLVVSVVQEDVLHYVAAAVGSYADGRFEADSWTRLTYGDPAPYAASAYRDAQGRPGLVAWFRGVADPGGGWAGALTIPTLLSLDGAGRPRLAPHANVAAARPEVSAGGRWNAGGCVDVEWSSHDGDALVLAKQWGEPVADLRAADEELSVVTSGGTYTMPWLGDDVRLLVDGSVLEVFSAGALMGAAIDPQHTRLDGSASTCRAWELA
jgi:beta-fructofuranosidase